MAGSSISNPSISRAQSLDNPGQEENSKFLDTHLIKCVERAAGNTNPVRTALRFLDHERTAEGTSVSISYGELMERVSRFAAFLKNNGIKSGDRVGIYFLNSPEYVVSFLSILKVGAVVVPINPLLKSFEIDHILGDSQALHLVASSKLLEESFPLERSLPNLENIFSVSYYEENKKDSDSARKQEGIPATRFIPVSIDSLADDKLVDILCSPDGLAVLVYTSGTTGNPKGAMLGHDNLVSAVTMKRDSFVVREADRLLAVLPLCHIYGMVVVMLGALTEGASLSIVESFDADGVLERIETDKITILPAVPAMFQFMEMAQQEKKRDTSSLSYCVTGGAAMDPAVKENAESSLGAPILEGYALTEVSCVATLTPIDGVHKSGSAGPAINGVTLKILNENGDSLPPGAENVGEVAIGGPQVMRGYFNQRQATEAVFKNDLFLTGDLGYLDDDGYLYICGRSKELIIRGGQNIYPREIELAIEKHPAVAAVAVVGVPDKYMGERVKAVIVAGKGREVDLSESALKSFLADKLAPYKIPRIFEFRESLPRNSTGKVLKRLLV